MPRLYTIWHARNITKSLEMGKNEQNKNLTVNGKNANADSLELERDNCRCSFPCNNTYSHSERIFSFFSSSCHRFSFSFFFPFGLSGDSSHPKQMIHFSFCCCCCRISPANTIRASYQYCHLFLSLSLHKCIFFSIYNFVHSIVDTGPIYLKRKMKS